MTNHNEPSLCSPKTLRMKSLSQVQQAAGSPPTVSVITPSHNAKDFLAKTIESVIAQTYTNWELLVIDDASTDGSLALAKTYEADDDRIRVISFPFNVGPANARNEGIKQSRGRFIAFLDGDDLWEPHKLDTQINVMLRENWAFSFGGYTHIGEDGNELAQRSVPERVTYEELLKTCVIGCLTAVYDTQQLGKIYMPQICKRQDYGLWLEILKRIKYGYGVKQNLGFYRIRVNSISRNKLSAIYYVWQLFRNHEKMSFVRSLVYTIWYSVAGFKKYYL